MTSLRNRRRWMGFAAPLAIAGLGLSSLAISGDTPSEVSAAVDPAEIMKMMRGGGGSKDDGDHKWPELSEVTKDMKAEEGLFTIYRYDPSDKTKDHERVLCKIPAKLLNQDMLLATSITSGGSFTSWMWQDELVRFEVVGRRLKVTTPDTRYVRKSGATTTDAVQRTYNDTYIATVPLVTLTSAGEPVFDLGALLKSNIAGVAMMGRGALRQELSRWSKLKVFPENTLFEVDLAFGSPDGSGTSVGVAYALRQLPALGAYKPRVADDRLGYFLTAQMDWSKKATDRDTFDRLINRWNLEKRDPSLELSPPKKPIVFYIEKTVPVQWRRWVREGILEWNQAFEKLGFTDAIVVRQQTEDNEFADLDPEDARYNFFRWIVSGRAFAMGPSRADPRTGEILDADIIMDDSFIRAWMHSLDIFSPSTIAQEKGPGFAEWREHRPELASQILDSRFPNPGDPQEQLFADVMRHMREQGHEVCTYADGFQQQLAFAYNAAIATASGKKIPEHFLGEAIREVVAHEVGHTLGLRHNFKGSSWLTMEEIKQRRDSSDEPTTGSVMDYNPLLFFPGDDVSKVRHFITPTLGPYDHWVIQYGYGIPAEGQSEADFLKAVASRCTEPGLQYATDSDTMWVYSCDPSVNRYDMGQNPMDWVKVRFELADQLVKNIREWAVTDGESRAYLTRAFNTLLNGKARDFNYLGRVIGGQYFNRDHKGDPGARPAFQLVDAKTQREALQMLNDTLFNENFLKTESALLNELAPHRWDHWGAPNSSRLDYPIHETIARLQFNTLFDITSPIVLQRIYDAELKCEDADKFTAAELVQSVRDHLWARLETPPNGSYTDSQPFLSSLARGLQRDYLDLMLTYVAQRPGMDMSPDLHAMLSFGMRELSDRIGAVLKDSALPDGKSKLDFASRAHLTESKSRIDRVLDAEFAAR